MLLTLLYLVLAGLILWSFCYIIARIVRSFRGKGGCSCSAKTSGGCSGCGCSRYKVDISTGKFFVL